MDPIKTIELNEYGRAAWRHYSCPDLFITTPYSWVDRYIMIDESDDKRTVVMEFDHETFQKLHVGWIPITVEENKKVITQFKDIYS